MLPVQRSAVDESQRCLITTHPEPVRDLRKNLPRALGHRLIAQQPDPLVTTKTLLLVGAVPEPPVEARPVQVAELGCIDLAEKPDGLRTCTLRQPAPAGLALVDALDGTDGSGNFCNCEIAFSTGCRYIQMTRPSGNASSNSEMTWESQMTLYTAIGRDCDWRLDRSAAG